MSVELEHRPLEVFTKCHNPKRIFNRYTKHWELCACGKCDACNSISATVQTERVKRELVSHRFNMFFTLTYDNDHIPTFEYFHDKNGVVQMRPVGRIADDYNYWPLCYDPHKSCKSKNIHDVMALIDRYNLTCIDETQILRPRNYDVANEFGVCSKRDIQLFMKRVRKNIDKIIFKNKKYEKSIRYYIASEYGPTTHRPHYHGIIFFDNEELLDKLQDIIVKSWGRFERTHGDRNKFVFRPFASSAHIRQYITLCSNTQSTAYYVANYVAGNTRLPQTLRHRLTKPFHLNSASPLIGSYKIDRSEMLEAFDSGIAYHSEQRIDKQEQCVKYIDVPYTKGDLRSVFRKCKEFSSLPAYAKQAIYSFTYQRRGQYEEYLRERGIVGVSPKYCNVLSFRDYCAKHHSVLYNRYCMSEDSNWYASTYAEKMVCLYPDLFKGTVSNGNSPILSYLDLFDKSLMLIEQYKLSLFYVNLDNWIKTYGVNSVFSAYPFLSRDLPMYVEDLYKPWNIRYLNIVNDLQLCNVLYPFGILNQNYLEDLEEVNHPFYQSYLNDCYLKYEKRVKRKKLNNSFNPTYGYRME